MLMNKDNPSSSLDQPFKRRRRRRPRHPNADHEPGGSKADQKTNPSRKENAGVSTRHRSVHRGALKQMLELPLETLEGILSYLHPRDLLRFARVSKATARLLLIRPQNGSRPWNLRVWAAVRKNYYQTPAPPSDLSEANYIQYLVDPVCMVCGGDTFLTALPIRLRICVNHQKEYISLRDFTADMKSDDKNLWTELLPTVRYQHSDITNRREAATLSEAHTRLHSSGNPGLIESQADVSKWIDEKKAEKIARLEFKKEIFAWQGRVTSGENAIKESGRIIRLQRITEKLQEAGFDPQDLESDPKLYKNTELQKLLSERMADFTTEHWDKISPHICAILEERRDIRQDPDKFRPRNRRERRAQLQPPKPEEEPYDHRREMEEHMRDFKEGFKREANHPTFQPRLQRYITTPKSRS